MLHSYAGERLSYTATPVKGHVTQLSRTKTMLPSYAGKDQVIQLRRTKAMLHSYAG